MTAPDPDPYEGRHYGAADQGPVCPICRTPTVAAIWNTERRRTHPACEGVDA